MYKKSSFRRVAKSSIVLDRQPLPRLRRGCEMYHQFDLLSLSNHEMPFETVCTEDSNAFMGNLGVMGCSTGAYCIGACIIPDRYHLSDSAERCRATLALNLLCFSLGSFSYVPDDML